MCLYQCFLLLQQALCFPVSLFDITTSSNDLWAVGSKGFLTIRKFFENKDSDQADACMESSVKDEYPFCGFETAVSASNFFKHSFHDSFFCLKSDLNENSILVCYENSKLSLWQVVLVINNSSASQNNLEYIQLLSFPSSYSRENKTPLIRSNFVIIIGEKGKLLLVTSEKLCSDADSSQPVSGLWILSWQLPSSVQSFIILNDCIIYCSFKGEVWIAKIHANVSQENGNVNHSIKVMSKASDFKYICSLSLINKDDGLFIMVTNTGSMYLMKYSDETSIVKNRALPILMNGILEQSLLLKDLASVTHFQSRLFAALSTFANIKFGATKKFNLECKMTEVEDFSKKLLISINLDGLQNLNLDTEFWMISASIFNHFQRDSSVITKCSPLVLGQTLHLEVKESNFSLSYSTPFPLFLEVGLILRVPKSFISLDCFKDIVKKLPLYIKTNTAILTELYLLKNKPKILENPKFTNNTENRNILQKILDNNAKNPLHKMLNWVPETYSPIFNKYTHCLLESTAEEFLKNLSKESSLEQSIFQAILKKSSLSDSDINNLLCQDQPLSLSVLQKDQKVHIVITSESLSILGLKTAIAELLLNNQSKSICEASNCVSIPASILKKCEELSKELRSMYGKDVTADNFLENVFKVYCKLRKEVSEKLPF